MNRHALLCFSVVFLCCQLAFVGLVQGQEEPAEEGVSFATVEACVSLQVEIEASLSQAKTLDALFPRGLDEREAMLAGIFQGTQTMLEYGEAMFAASDAWEEKCKAALREGRKAEEIIHLYDLLLEPTALGLDFLVRVRETAERLKDTATVDEMNLAIAEFREAAMQLADFCEADIPKEEHESTCAEFRVRLDKRLAK